MYAFTLAVNWTTFVDKLSLLYQHICSLLCKWHMPKFCIAIEVFDTENHFEEISYFFANRKVRSNRASSAVLTNSDDGNEKISAYHIFSADGVQNICSKKKDTWRSTKTLSKHRKKLRRFVNGKRQVWNLLNSSTLTSIGSFRNSHTSAFQMYRCC